MNGFHEIDGGVERDRQYIPVIAGKGKCAVR